MPIHDIQAETWKQLAGTEAAKLVKDGMVIGLGTGSTANAMIYALGNRLQREGLQLVGAVPSSQASRDLADGLGIPITNLDTHPELDLYIDGADEIDPDLHLLKGAGGALLREKIVASASRHFVVIGDVSKKVEKLGTNFPIPVETVPFAMTPVRHQLEALGAVVHIRQIGSNAFITENNNVILDCTFEHGVENPEKLDEQLHSIVGVVETGLFLHLTYRVILGGPDGVQTLP